MDDRYQNTIETWKHLSSIYHEKFKDIRLYDDSYEAFASKLQPTSSLLEIGCGPGTATRWLKNRLPEASILATDVASEMIEEAQKHVSDVHFQVLDAREIHTLNQQFDAIFSGFCIPYLTKNDLNQFIESASKLLNAKGIIYLSCIEKAYDQSYTQTGSTGHKMSVFYYLEQDILQLFKQHGLQHLETIRIDYPLPTGESDTHLVLLASKK
ncbi:MAG: class I SAM-dependent methyltransferase [Flavobacteriales bacterium]|nr:class I SAM-dependent methyltransferase [Flavobacteriales bacterium]